MTEPKTSPTLMVVAFDIGTSYSGYSFSSKAQFERNPANVYANQSWKDSGRVTIKCPTCVLFDQDKKFLSFGYEAQTRYVQDVLLDKKENEHYFFREFKLNLYSSDRNFDEEFLIEDVLGKPMSAEHVFSSLIAALKGHFLQEFRSRDESQAATMLENEISWVITVPAIWSEPAKHFMRRCAIKANLEKVSIVYEPEAAAIFCFMSESSTRSDKFLLVDMGGGTTDIVVQERQYDRLANLCQPCGDHCGGTTVDREFFNVLKKIVQAEVLSRFKREFPDDYFDLCKNVETMKQVQDVNRIRMQVPISSFDKLCQDQHGKSFTEVLNASQFRDHMRVIGGKTLDIKKELFLMLFQSTNKRIIQLIKKALENCKRDDISIFYMVGGLSDSFVVREAIKHAFPDKDLVIPEEASSAVMKGAVIYGHDENIIAARIMKVSYGIASSVRFDPKRHNRTRMVKENGIERCRDVFSVLVKANSRVFVGNKCSNTFHTVREYQEYVLLRLYSSPHENPVYIDEEGCDKLAEITISIDPPEKETVFIEIQFEFGRTEIQVIAKRKGTNKIEKHSLKYY